MFLLLLVSLLPLPVVGRLAQGSPDVVISQIYGGGGSTTGTYPRDFVELFNRGEDPVVLDGWTVQYASAASGSWRAIPLRGEIPPGSFYLLEGGPRTAPSPVEPAVRGLPDISASRGKVALVSAGITLACTASCGPDAAIRDFVGYGVEATGFEGGAPAPAGSGSAAVVRKDGGRQDSDVNGDDFAAASPAPRNDVVLPCGSGPTTGEEATIAAVQGTGHRSPLEDQPVANVTGIVTALRSDGFYLQDPVAAPSDDASSGLFVFTRTAACLQPGDMASVSGLVREFRRDPDGLSLTEIVSPTFHRISRTNALPPPVVIGAAGRVPPAAVFANPAGGNVEALAEFDPAANAIDFYEGLEGMRVQIDDAVVVGPTNSSGELVVLGDGGVGAELPSAGGGVMATADNPNPDRIILDRAAGSTPRLDVGAHFQGPIVGVLDYDRGTYRVQVTQAAAAIAAERAPLPLPPATAAELVIATLNVHNLDPGDGSQFDRLARIIVDDLGAPDIVALEEVQDDTGEPGPDEPDDAVVTADLTGLALIDAIHQVSDEQITYRYVDVDPIDDHDGGAPGGNIRIGFLFRPNRVSLINEQPGDATTATQVLSGADGLTLTVNPGRVDPTNPAFAASRKPLVALFAFGDERVVVIGNHFASKGADAPLFGPVQPPPRPSEGQRVAQAEVVNGFVEEILAHDPNANVIVLGDFNDYEYSETLDVLRGDDLTNLTDELDPDERYSYVFQGNSQMLDHLLVSPNLANGDPFHRIIHVNAEFADQASDHDPQVARFLLSP
jgi:predicted extracellular nuclease